MSNLDLVHSIYADWERSDYGDADWAHPDIEFVLADGPDPGEWTGRARMWEGWRGRLDAFADYRTEVEDYRVLDDERVLVLTHDSGRGKASGLPLGEMAPKEAVLFHIREGRVRRLVIYFDPDRALADLGLTSESEDA